uniref:Uncharacterized protein n=1 Tax=Salix viminalis TaxID=40686 RepID=A0A6N2L5M5_SALVM
MVKGLEDRNHKRKAAMLTHLNDHAGKKFCQGESWRDSSISGKEFPTGAKFMLPSHVSGGFWLVDSHFRIDEK